MINEESKKYKRWIKPSILVLPSVLLLMALSQTAQSVPNGGYAHPEILIQPEDLKILIEKRDPSIRIIDVREKPQYLSGHIPGAVQVWRPDIEDKMHALPGMLALREQVENLMGNLGISDKNMIIIYSDGPDNARLWWTLAYYGFPFKQMKLLDGGIDAWKTKGYPTEMTPPRTEKAGFKLPKETQRGRSMLCTLADVKAALKKPDKVVLDVRSKKEYLGEEMKKGATRAGRIPGVTWIEWKETIVEEGPSKGYWKSAEGIKKIFSAKGVTPGKDIYIY
jgi:thiosulfate/3-mercaptopyruvate sulfurtransferase